MIGARVVLEGWVRVSAHELVCVEWSANMCVAVALKRTQGEILCVTVGERLRRMQALRGGRWTLLNEIARNELLRAKDLRCSKVMSLKWQAVTREIPSSSD